MKRSSSERAVAPAPTLRDVMRTLYIHGTLMLTLAAFMVLAGPFLYLGVHTFDRRRRVVRRAVRAVFPRLIRHYCWLGGRPLRVDAAPFDWERVGPCIVVANHASSMDVLLLMMLPLPVGDGRVWAKGWPFRVPLLGALMRLSGHLFVEDFNILPDAEAWLEDGGSLLVFPESSRTRTGRVGRFREGAFLLAARTGRPVIPVALHGSFACMPAGQGWVFHPTLRVQPLGCLRAPEGMAGEKPHGWLRRQAREMIVRALEEGGQREETRRPAAA